MLVPGDQRPERGRLREGRADGVGRGVLAAGAGEHAGEDLADGGRLGRGSVAVDVERGLGGGVPGGVVAAAGRGDVQRLAGHLRGDQRVRGVGGRALDAMRGGGVRELDRVGHIGGGEAKSSAVLEVPHRQGAVVVAAFDAPGVAVADPVAAAPVGQGAGVGPGDDPVADPGEVGVVQLDAIELDLAGGRRVRPGRGR